MAPESNGSNPFEEFQSPGPNQFEIPKDFLKQFEKGRSNEGDVPPLRQGKAKLGVQLSDATPDLRSQFHIPADVNGAVVLGVGPGSVADRLGVQPGDLITKFDGKSVSSAKELSTMMGSVNWGDSKRLQYNRYADNGVSTVDTSVTFR